MEKLINYRLYKKTMSFFSLISLFIQTFLPFTYFDAKSIFAADPEVPAIVEQTPTPAPAEPVQEPTSAPANAELVEAPTAAPTAEPAIEPTSVPTEAPTETPVPTLEPTAKPVNAELVEAPVVTETPTPELTPTTIPVDVTSSPLPPTITPTAQPSVEPTPANTEPVEVPVVEQVCLTDEVVKDSVDADWNRDDISGISETTGKVQIGVRYLFPQENKVSVMFTCLPKDESLRAPLKIQQVKVTDLKLPEGINPATEYAYDITTGMNDGDFKYDVTLPKNENQTAEVSYIEKSIEDAKTNPINVSEVKQIEENKVEQESLTIKATDVDHFSIYISTKANDFSTDKSSYTQGETVYVHSTVSGNDANKYYRLAIQPPGLSKIYITSCQSIASFLDGTYSLPSDASISSNWYAELIKYPNSNCSNNPNISGNDQFSVIAVPTPTPSSVCGNGTIETGEECDDKNNDIKDGCSDKCIVESGWACDANEPSVCSRIDTDGDGIPDASDNCPTVFNPTQTDNDGDAIGDACDPDNDNDGIPDASDCQPLNPAVYPGATEIPDNGVDEDCNGFDAKTCYADSDQDGYGSISTVLAPDGACDTAQFESDNSLDCNDSSFIINPTASEICDGFDNNCDGSVDEGVMNTFYQDADQDKYGDPDNSTQACSRPFGYVEDNTDCDDAAAAVHPKSVEFCNGIDDNCDSLIDNAAIDASTWYKDADGDGYGNSASSIQACSLPFGYTPVGGDCHDGDSSIHPNALDFPDDGIDQDCNDSDTKTCFVDFDKDGYGGDIGIPVYAEDGTCDTAQSESSTSDDCDDTAADIHPGATEILGDSIDQDCDGTDSVLNTVNPSLSASCGLDIAFAIDSSGSFSTDNLNQIKSALKDFVDDLIPGTPTQFSVTDFDTAAAILQPFSGNAATIKTALDIPVPGGLTNWEDALTKSYSTFDPRADKPDLSSSLSLMVLRLKVMVL